MDPRTLSAVDSRINAAVAAQVGTVIAAQIATDARVAAAEAAIVAIPDPIMQSIRKVGDQLNIGTAYADVTGLGFAVVAGTTYMFRYLLIADSDAVTTGIDVAVNGPATTLLNYTSTYWTSATAIATAGATAYDNNPASLNSNGATQRIFVIEGIVTPSANGTLIPRAKREAVGTGPNVRGGSLGLLWTL